MNTEGGRLSQKLTSISRGCSNAALLEARRLYGGAPDSCSGCGVSGPLGQQVQLPSDVLAATVADCFSAVIGRQVGPESVRTNTLAARTVEAYYDQTNPETRFVQYRPPYIPPVCPPIPTEILNANIPKSSKRCPLPNKGYNPNLPA